MGKTLISQLAALLPLGIVPLSAPPFRHVHPSVVRRIPLHQFQTVTAPLHLVLCEAGILGSQVLLHGFAHPFVNPAQRSVPIKGQILVQQIPVQRILRVGGIFSVFPDLPGKIALKFPGCFQKRIGALGAELHCIARKCFHLLLRVFFVKSLLGPDASLRCKVTRDFFPVLKCGSGFILKIISSGRVGSPQ